MVDYPNNKFINEKPKAFAGFDLMPTAIVVFIGLILFFVAFVGGSFLYLLFGLYMLVAFWFLSKTKTRKLFLEEIILSLSFPKKINGSCFFNKKYFGTK